MLNVSIPPVILEGSAKLLLEDTLSLDIEVRFFYYSYVVTRFAVSSSFSVEIVCRIGLS